MYSLPEYRAIKEICEAVGIPEDHIARMVNEERDAAKQAGYRKPSDQSTLQQLYTWITEDSPYIGSHTLDETLGDLRELVMFVGTRRRAYVWAKLLSGVYKASHT